LFHKTVTNYIKISHCCLFVFTDWLSITPLSRPPLKKGCRSQLKYFSHNLFDFSVDFHAIQGSTESFTEYVLVSCCYTLFESNDVMESWNYPNTVRILIHFKLLYAFCVLFVCLRYMASLGLTDAVLQVSWSVVVPTAQTINNFY